MGVRIAPAGPTDQEDHGPVIGIDNAGRLFFALDDAVVVKLANTPGREPGEPRGCCAFESRQPHQGE